MGCAGTPQPQTVGTGPALTRFNAAKELEGLGRPCAFASGLCRKARGTPKATGILTLYTLPCKWWFLVSFKEP